MSTHLHVCAYIGNTIYLCLCMCVYEVRKREIIVKQNERIQEKLTSNMNK